MEATDVVKGLFGVEGKVVVVTGGSRGIGHGIATGFVRAGARVYICARNMTECEASAAALRALGDCVPIQADLSTVAGCRALAELVAESETRVDVLVNNAGAIWFDDVANYPESEWDAVMNVNLKATFFLTQALLPLLTRSAAPKDPARVINVGSIRGYIVPSRPSFAYTASKGAVHQLSRHLAAQLAPAGITVNVLAPGLYETRMRRPDASDAAESTVSTPIPLGRFADAEDVAGAAIFLASRAGSYLTGTVIPVDGGVGVATN
jgi:NAD(P)-dependent dehydrogenase (short-subunit alcohol dehydrogenase family)